MAVNTVWITEKPTMGRALAATLGGRGGDGVINTPEGKVTWAFGHLLREKTPDEIDPKYAKWRFEDLPLILDDIPVAPGDPGAKKQLQLIGNLLRDADLVVIATDADRAGERIAREILLHHKYRGPLERLLLRSPEPSDVRDAIRDMRSTPNSARRTEPWFYEERGRAFDDYHIGMSGSRAGTIRLRPNAFHREPWSLGGVQTPTLAMIVDRDIAIETFVPRDFHVVHAEVDSGGTKMRLSHDPKDRIFDKAIADRIEAAAKNWAGDLDVQTEVKSVEPYKLFNQTTLQQRAGKMFGWAPAHTLNVAQRLYDGGYITYPRGKCEYIGTSSIPKVNAALQGLRKAPGFEALDAYLNRAQPVIRNGTRYNDKAVKASAHEAIIPTSKVPQLTSLSSDERALYTLLAKNLAANHMPAGKDDTATVQFSVDVDGKARRFALSGKRIVSLGWRELIPPSDDKGANGLPPAKNGDKAAVAKTEIRTGTTEPPKRWADWDLPVVMDRLENYIETATHLSDGERKKLIDALQTDNPEEPMGLGTPATRASIISTLVKRGYIDVLDGKGVPLSADAVKKRLEPKSDGAKGDKAAKSGKGQADGAEGKGGAKKATSSVRATPNGRALVLAWRQIYPDITDPVRRARLEDQLRLIGKASSPDEARAEFERLKERVHEETRAIVAAAAKAERFQVSEADAASMRGVTPKQVAFAKSIAAFRKIKFDKSMANDAAALSKFIDENKPKDGEVMVSKKQIELAQRVAEIYKTGDDMKALANDPARVAELLDAHPPESWPVSDKQRDAVRSIAQAKGVALAEGWESDNKFMRKFLDDHAGDAAKVRAATPPSEASLNYAKNIAAKLNLDAAKLDFGSQAAVSAFIDKHQQPQSGARRRSGDRGR